MALSGCFMYKGRVSSDIELIHYENLPMHYTEILFLLKKSINFISKNLIFLKFLFKTDCGYMLELPHRGGPNQYSQSMFWIKITKEGIPHLQGHVLREITAITRRQGTAVTAVCHDADCNIIVTGDHSKLCYVLYLIDSNYLLLVCQYGAKN